MRFGKKNYAIVLACEYKQKRSANRSGDVTKNWTRTSYNVFLFELTTTKILRNIKIVVASRNLAVLP